MLATAQTKTTLARNSRTVSHPSTVSQFDSEHCALANIQTQDLLATAEQFEKVILRMMPSCFSSMGEGRAMTECTLASRTPATSPFAILYAPRRAQADTATAPAKRGPKKRSKAEQTLMAFETVPERKVRQKAEKEAKILRVNPERPDCASWAGMSKKAGI